MRRTYAGILGCLAFTAVAVRGVIAGGPAEAVAVNACWSMLAFAALGCLAGDIAGRTVDESARAQVDMETNESNG